MLKTNNKNLKKGFTLIEVLLVIVLVGILLAIGLTSINIEARFVENRNDTRKNHIKTIEGAIAQYRLQEGSYPAGLDRTYREICDPDASACVNFVDLKAVLVPKYLQAIPQDPNDTDNTGGAGYEVAIDTTTNTVSVRLKELLREGGVIIAVNDPLPAESTTTANSSLAATVPVTPPPPIVTNGLVLHLDAGNPASYPETGTTWFDLSGNGNTGTLTKGPTYSSSNGGSLTFDGTDDYVSLTNNSLPTGNYTINCWVKTPSGIPVIQYDMIISTSQHYWYLAIYLDKFTIDNNDGLLRFGPTLSASTWYNVAVTRSGSMDTAYINGVSQGTNTNSAALSGNWEIGRWAYSPSHYWTSGISQVSIYNKALTASEIQQNFNATRGRFGL